MNSISERSIVAQDTNPFGEPTSRGGAYTLVISDGPVPATAFIPFSYASSVPNFVCKLIYTPLVFLDREWNEFTPALARSWEWSADNLQLTLHLRDDVAFHDGQRFSARDVEFTLKLLVRKQLVRPSFPDISILEGAQAYRDRTTDVFSGIEVVDDATVRINLSSPSNVFLRQLTSVGIVPAHAFSDDALASEGDTTEIPFFLENPIGTGPFKLASYDTQTNVTLEKNQDYFKSEPVLDSIVLRFGVAATAQVAGLRSGEFDGVYLGNQYDAAQALENVDSTRLEVQQFLSHAQMFIVACEKDYMNVAVRQALVTALDIPTLIETVGYGYPEQLPAIMMFQGLFPNPSLPSYSYDPNRAQELLAQGSWDSGRTLVLGQSSEQGTPSNIIAQIVNQWRAIGVQAEYRPFDPANQTTLWQAEQHEYDVYFASYAQLAYDPSSTYDAFVCGLASNYASYCNPDYDELIAQAIRESEPEQAMDLYRRVQTLLQTELPYMPFWLEPMVWGVNTSVHGGILGRGPMNDVLAEQWWLEG